MTSGYPSTQTLQGHQLPMMAAEIANMGARNLQNMYDMAGYYDPYTAGFSGSPGGRSPTLAREQFERNSAIAEGDLMGYFGGQPTLGRERFLADKALGEGGLTGYFNGAPTLSRERMMIEKALSEGDLMGMYGGQPTMAAGALLGEFLGRPTLDAQRLSAQREQFEKTYGLERGSLLGSVDGMPTMDAQRLAAAREQFEKTFGLERGSLLGAIDGMPTLDAQRLAAARDQFERAFGLDVGLATGSYGGAPTMDMRRLMEAQAAFGANFGLQRGLAQLQQQNAQAQTGLQTLDMLAQQRGPENYIAYNWLLNELPQGDGAPRGTPSDPFGFAQQVGKPIDWGTYTPSSAATAMSNVTPPGPNMQYMNLDAVTPTSSGPQYMNLQDRYVPQTFPPLVGATSANPGVGGVPPTLSSAPGGAGGTGGGGGMDAAAALAMAQQGFGGDMGGGFGGGGFGGQDWGNFGGAGWDGMAGYDIPGFAHGGVTNAPLIEVGEEGPELLALAPGSQVEVIPEQGMRGAAAGGAPQDTWSQPLNNWMSQMPDWASLARDPSTDWNSSVNGWMGQMPDWNALAGSATSGLGGGNSSLSQSTVNVNGASQGQQRGKGRKGKRGKRSMGGEMPAQDMTAAPGRAMPARGGQGGGGAPQMQFPGGGMPQGMPQGMPGAQQPTGVDAMSDDELIALAFSLIPGGGVPGAAEGGTFSNPYTQPLNSWMSQMPDWGSRARDSATNWSSTVGGWMNQMPDWNNITQNYVSSFNAPNSWGGANTANTPFSDVANTPNTNTNSQNVSVTTDFMGQGVFGGPPPAIPDFSASSFTPVTSQEAMPAPQPQANPWPNWFQGIPPSNGDVMGGFVSQPYAWNAGTQPMPYPYGRPADRSIPGAAQGGTFANNPFGQFERYDINAVNRTLPAFQKLFGQGDFGAWGRPNMSMNQQVSFPSLFNVSRFSNLAPSEMGMTKGLYSSPRSMGGMGMDWNDIVERSMRAAPMGATLPRSDYGWG